MHNIRNWIAVALIALGGCGAHEDPVAVTFNPAALTATYAQGDTVVPIQNVVTLSRALSGDFFIRLLQDAEVLEPTLSVTVNSTTSFNAYITPKCMLTPGTHAGKLALALCMDASCNLAIPTSGSVLPYSFDVGPGLVVTAKLGGVDVGSTFSRCASSRGPDVKPGQRLELTSSEPVAWNHDVWTSRGVPVVSGLAKTSTTWSAILSDSSGGNTPGVSYGTVNVYANPESGKGGGLHLSCWIVGG